MSFDMFCSWLHNSNGRNLACLAQKYHRRHVGSVCASWSRRNRIRTRILTGNNTLHLPCHSIINPFMHLHYLFEMKAFWSFLFPNLLLDLRWRLRGVWSGRHGWGQRWPDLIRGEKFPWEHFKGSWGFQVPLRTNQSKHIALDNLIIEFHDVVGSHIYIPTIKIY